MKTIVKKLYEGMFLVDSAEAAADWDGVEARIKNILERADVEIISIRKWEDRRLAYEIDKKSRGTYILCYFRSDGKRIGDIERDVQLSERIMRVLILSADHLTQDDIEKDTPAVLAEKQKEEGHKAVAEQVSAVEDSGTDYKVRELAVGAAEETGVEPVSTEGSSEVEDEPAELSEDTAGASKEAAEQSEEPKQATKVRKSRKRRSKTAETSAEASESEQQAEAETKKDDSESAEGQDKEGTDEK